MKVQKRDRFAIWASNCMGRLQAKLHVSPSHIVLLDWCTKDAEGKVLEQIEGKSHSFVRNYHNICASVDLLTSQSLGSTYGAGLLQPKATNGTVASGTTLGLLPSNGPVNNATYGIVVGTGTTAESFEDYVLQTPIAHGTGSGQLQYAAEAATLTYSTKVWTSQISRGFTNGSGGTITIREVGMYRNSYNNTAITTTSGIYAMIRDTSGVSIAVTNGSATTITYTMTYTFP